MTNEEYWFWLCNIKNFWQNDIKKLLNGFASPENVFRADKNDLIECGKLNDQQAELVLASKEKDTYLRELEKIKNDGIKVLFPDSEEYPEALKKLSDMPYSLYIKGNIPSSEILSVGMVGARACSGYGREMARNFSAVLSSAGIQIISGMAVGIDTVSANAAISVGGRTFAVLGCGINVIYPRENTELYYNIILNGGGIISEYPVATRPWPWQFPHRNRLISAFSDKLIVIEAGKHSGTLSTVNHALNQGKDIYALPGRINDKLSEGCNSLIADGAGILISPELFLEEIMECSKPVMALETNNECNGFERISSDRKKIYECLSFEPIGISDIANITGLTPQIITSSLSELELDGFVTRVSSAFYVKTNV